MTTICVSKMLSGLRKCSQSIPVNEVWASAGGMAVAIGLAGWSLEPAERMSQTPPMKKTMSKK